MISGGEPMLRDDFIEIFDYITSKAASYSLNTNGSLITPEIAELMKRKGSKMIALYGATPEVSDHITRHPGSFEATMQGMNSLKEAGASFIVQIIPMRDNYHQLDEMINLAKSLSSHWRIGVSWLYLSASRDFAKNLEISGQRLEPSCVIDLDKPDIAFEEKDFEEGHHHFQSGNDDRLFASCIANKHRFNVDPYGKMTFCSFVKDPALRYDLRSGSF
jgi:MoaA/NifB/PqqE/SkfB family radical SAM enzyme